MGRFPPWDESIARSIIDRLKDLDGAALPILHALQDAFGYIDREAVPLIAEALNISRAEVHGTITFYHDFRSEPPGRRVVKLCRAEACQSVGCEALVEHLASDLGIAMDTTTPDGALTIETVYCLGNCALGPSALVDGEIVGHVDPQLLREICGEAAPARVLS